MKTRKAAQGIRIEQDSLGPVEVACNVLWGAQTQRAINHFRVSGLGLPRAMICSLGLVKAVAARTHAELGLMEPKMAKAIERAAMAVSRGDHDDQFPVDIFQTGSGTSSNMNANEVIAALASRRLRRQVHPNDHVNLGQSSNDTIPTAIHVAACQSLQDQLKPALTHLHRVILQRAKSLGKVVKTGRTHLMDAMPIRMDQELSAWAQQISNGVERLDSAMPRLLCLAQGGTAVGSGINAHPSFAGRFARNMARQTGLKFKPSPNAFESISSMDAACELSGQLKVIACSQMKIANDLRWMNSGPLAGLGEIALPQLQPGSSIMPGKINPVAAEAVCMIAARVIGNDTSVTVAAQSGNFQLNVMLPLIAHCLIDSIVLLSRGAMLLADKAISDFEVREARLAEALQKNPILITAANSVLGYDKGAEIAKQAYRENRPLIDVAREQTDLSDT